MGSRKKAYTEEEYNKLKDKPLTQKQLLFCNEYIKTGNGLQSAIAAGYSEKTAVWQASTVLTYPHVQSYIQKMRDKMEKTSIASAQDVMEYFTKVMNGEIKDQFGLDAPLSERTKAASELAKRTVDLENRMAGRADATVEIKLDWSRDEQ